jgi:FAD:protein FMN transferase
MGLRSGTVRVTPFHHHPVLGTDATGFIESNARGKSGPERLESLLLKTVDEMENVFSAYRRDSEFCKWRRGETFVVSQPLLEVLARAQFWVTQSNGAFNPSVGIASELWAAASSAQSAPSDKDVQSVVEQLRTLPFQAVGEAINRTGDCQALNLNAIAKGYIVDRAADAVLGEKGVESIVLNVGGDLIHRGTGSTSVRIQNPLRAYDNEPPMYTLNVADAAVATSGSAARGWQIGETWFSHVIDPRTARPVSEIASASVIAQTAIEADAIATVLSVVNDDERLRFAQQLEPEVGYCVVRSDGSTATNSAWNILCT